MAHSRRTLRPPEPERTALSAQSDVEAMVRDLLRTHHRLEIPLKFLILVEGTTDVRYLHAASQRVKEHTGFDLLDLDGDCHITLCTPVTPNEAGVNRGGLPQIERLADDLKVYAVRYELVGPLCFVLDHDSEGERVKAALRKSGYSSDRAAAITLDFKEHPGACRLARKGDDPVVIEDLLSLQIQKRFFQQSRPSCDVTYIEGDIVRFAWRKPSKDELCEYVCGNAQYNDLIEVVRILCRVRSLWRFEIPPIVADLLDKATTVGQVSAPER